MEKSLAFSMEFILALREKKEKYVYIEKELQEVSALEEKKYQKTTGKLVVQSSYQEAWALSLTF